MLAAWPTEFYLPPWRLFDLRWLFCEATSTVLKTELLLMLRFLPVDFLALRIESFLAKVLETESGYLSPTPIDVSNPVM